MAAVPSIGRASFVERSRVAPQAAATEGLYQRHAAKLQSYCLHQLGSREEAEDAVQTTYMNAFRALGRGIVPEAESAWLFKIAENVCLSRRRSSWRRGRIESPSDFGVIEEIVPGPSRQNDELIGIEDALASMPEQQRRAILLREWQGLSYREVAEELEISQSAVETLIFRARRSLAQGLEQPDTVKPKRKSFRRALHAFDFGTVAAAIKTLLAGGAAVKATVAAVAVTAAAGTAFSVEKIESRPPTRAAAPAKTLVTKPASVIATFAPASASVAPAVGSAPERSGQPAPAAKPARDKSKAAPAAVVENPAPVSDEPAAVAPVQAAPAEQTAAPAEPAGQPAPEQAPVAAATRPVEPAATRPVEPAATRPVEPVANESKIDEVSKATARETDRTDTPTPVIVPTAAPASQAKIEPVAVTHAVTIVTTPVAPTIVTNPAVTAVAPVAVAAVVTTRPTIQPVPVPATN